MKVKDRVAQRRRLTPQWAKVQARVAMKRLIGEGKTFILKNGLPFKCTSNWALAFLIFESKGQKIPHWMQKKHDATTDGGIHP